MSDEIPRQHHKPECTKPDGTCDCPPESSLAAPAGSTPTQQCAQELWDLFMRHNLSYEQCINAMVATTKMIGRKACDDEVGAFCMFLHQAMKICPDLGDVAKEPNPDSTTAKP